MNTSLFPASVYINRRNELKQKIGSGIILLLGNEQSPMNYKDNWYPFRQDSTFLYYFGLDVDGLTAVIDVDNDHEIIFGNELTLDDIVWTGALPSLKEMAARVGVSITKPIADVSSYLKNVLEAKREVYWLPPYRTENKIKISEWLSISLEAATKYASVKLIKAVVKQRSIKEAAEVVEMEKAVSRSVDVHLAAMKYAVAGMKEYQVVAELESVARAADGRMAYPTIATVRGQVLHNHFYGNALESGQMMLIDAGVETALGYCGDLTRTFPIDQKFTSIQRDVYAIVLGAFNAAVQALKPGIKFKDVHLLACKNLVSGLKQLGLMKGDVEDAVAAGAHAMFFQCGLGHMIGLDVHDMEDLGEEHVGYSNTIKRSAQFGLKSLRLARELENGFALTVEPGIYFIPELMDQWQAQKKHEAFINYTSLQQYRDFGGIRIEDNFLITEHGSRVLGKPLPRSIEEIESLRESVMVSV